FLPCFILLPYTTLFRSLAQVAKFRGQVAESFPDCPGIELGGIALSRIGPERRWNHYFHGHFISPLCWMQPPAYTAARWRISISSGENSARSSFKRQEVMSCGAPFCMLTMM